MGQQGQEKSLHQEGMAKAWITFTVNLLYNGYRVFPGSKAAEAWRWPPTTSNTEVKERVELYPYSPSGLSWPVIRWTVPLPISFTCMDGWMVGCVCECVCVCVHLWLCVYKREWISAHVLSASVCVRVNIRIYIYVYIYTYICNICMHMFITLIILTDF